MKPIFFILLLAIFYNPHTESTKNNNNSLDRNIFIQETQDIPFDMSKITLTSLDSPVLKSYQEFTETKESTLEYKNKHLIFRHCDDIFKKLNSLDYSLQKYNQLLYFLNNIQRGEYKPIIWAKLFSNNFYFHT